MPTLQLLQVVQTRLERGGGGGGGGWANREQRGRNERGRDYNETRMNRVMCQK